MLKLNSKPALFLAVMLGFGAPAIAQNFYIYTDAAGKRWVTDHRRNDFDAGMQRQDYRPGDPQKPRASPQFDRLIQRAARRYALEPALVKAVVHVESAFNPDALSHKGALGLMQLMPGTAARYGVIRRRDPAENINAGTHYLRDLHVMFGNNTQLALAAYNAGENAVQKYGGVPPFAETQRFIRKVLRMRAHYRRAAGDGVLIGMR